MAKTKHVLHASLMCLATSGWCVNVWSEDKEFLRMIPIEGWNAEPETEAQALRALKDQAFVWAVTQWGPAQFRGTTSAVSISKN
jgi:hypothetical protein